MEWPRDVSTRYAEGFFLRLVLSVIVAAGLCHAQTTDSIVLRGHRQEVRIYGVRGSGEPGDSCRAATADGYISVRMSPRFWLPKDFSSLALM